MFYRKVITDLELWANSAYRKSLILRGARQVGKTTAVRMFAEQFDTFIELNLEEEADRALFISGTDVHKLYNLIKLAKNVVTTGKNVLLFIDEIQYSANAILGLRYFYEKMPDLFVIAAGSLLEAYLARQGLEVSVGRIEYLWVYPLDFEEFLQAQNQQALLQQISRIPYPDYAIQPLKEQFTQFCMVGGMPEAVKAWLETNDIVQVRRIQAGIIDTYTDDIGKYSSSRDQKDVILHVMKSAYFNICKRIGFDGFGETAYRSLAVKQAFMLLSQVSLFTLFYPTTAYNLPALPNFRKKPKLLAFDLGIVNYVAGIQDKYYSENTLHSIFKGAAMEQIVGQQLLSMQHRYSFTLKYWVRENRSSSAELDYLIEWHNMLIPVEVKSGKTGTMKSLFLFMQESDSTLAVRIYDGLSKWEKVVSSAGKEFMLLHLNLGLVTRIFDYLNDHSNSVKTVAIRPKYRQNHRKSTQIV